MIFEASSAQSRFSRSRPASHDRHSWSALSARCMLSWSMLASQERHSRSASLARGRLFWLVLSALSQRSQSSPAFPPLLHVSASRYKFHLLFFSKRFSLSPTSKRIPSFATSRVWRDKSEGNGDARNEFGKLCVWERDERICGNGFMD